MDDLLYIKALKPDLHIKQLAFMETLTGSEKLEHARMFRFGNASMHYYENTEPTEDDYNHWLSGSENIKKDMIKRSYEGCKTILALQRHALERRDVGMDAFMKTFLNEEDFTAWQNAGQ